MIDFKDISVVFQGPVIKDLTAECIESVRQYLPGAEIILATYAGTDTSGFNCDQAVLVVDVGSFRCNNLPKSKPNNVNRQIQTTLAGLRAATRKYAFKLRSDFILNGNDFFSYFDQFPKFDPKYKVFEKKILTPVFFSRNPHNKCRPDSYPFHPSDIAFFGLHTDLLNLFDIPLMTNEKISYVKLKNITSCRYVPEQYIWINCLRKNGKDILCDFRHHCNSQIAEESDRYTVSNFIYLDYEQFNLKPPRKLRLFSENDFCDVVTHIEWQKLYQKYLDNTLPVAGIDYLRMHIDKNALKCRFLYNLPSLFFPGKCLKNFRRRIRMQVKRYLLKGKSIPC